MLTHEVEVWAKRSIYVFSYLKLFMQLYEPPVSLQSSYRAGFGILFPFLSDSRKQKVCRCWSHLKASSKISDAPNLSLAFIN